MTAPTAPKLAMPAAPKLFALVLDEEDPDYAEFVAACQPTDRVVWWGTEFDGQAVLYRITPDGKLDTARSRDAALAEDRFNQVYPVKLEWL